MLSEISFFVPHWILNDNKVVYLYVYQQKNNTKEKERYWEQNTLPQHQMQAPQHVSCMHARMQNITSKQHSVLHHTSSSTFIKFEIPTFN